MLCCRPDVKLWQCLTLMREVEQIAAARDVAVIVCGDFNRWALHCSAMHLTTLDSTTHQCTTLHYTALHCTKMHCL
jgi:endonuclease/exonuclease/phosphatase family metal-dependent hydrolase